MTSAAPPLDPKACPCQGSGWRYVREHYAEQLYPEPPPTGDTSPDGVAAYLAKVEHARLMRAAALQSVYPCREHNAAMFFRWAGGHLGTDHDRSECPECSELLPRNHRGHHAPTPARREPRPTEPGFDF